MVLLILQGKANVRLKIVDKILVDRQGY